MKVHVSDYAVIYEQMHTVHSTVISETLQIDIFRFILQLAAH